MLGSLKQLDTIASVFETTTFETCEFSCLYDFACTRVYNLCVVLLACMYEYVECMCKCVNVYACMQSAGSGEKDATWATVKPNEDPLAVNTQNQWTQFYADERLRDEIAKDVRRTHSSFHFFARHSIDDDQPPAPTGAAAVSALPVVAAVNTVSTSVVLPEPPLADLVHINHGELGAVLGLVDAPTASPSSSGTSFSAATPSPSPAVFTTASVSTSSLTPVTARSATSISKVANALAAAFTDSMPSTDPTAVSATATSSSNGSASVVATDSPTTVDPRAASASSLSAPSPAEYAPYVRLLQSIVADPVLGASFQAYVDRVNEDEDAQLDPQADGGNVDPQHPPNTDQLTECSADVSVTSHAHAPGPGTHAVRQVFIHIYTYTHAHIHVFQRGFYLHVVLLQR